MKKKSLSRKTMGVKSSQKLDRTNDEKLDLMSHDSGDLDFDNFIKNRDKKIKKTLALK